MQRDLRLGSWTLRVDCNRLDNPERSVTLEPKLVDLLCYLSRRGGETIGKREIFEAVWPDVHVGDDVIWRGISELRRALGDDTRDSRYIQTVARKGYRWVGPVPVSLPPRLRARRRLFSFGRAWSARTALFATGMLMGLALTPVQSALQPLLKTASVSLVCCADTIGASDAPHCPMDAAEGSHECCRA